MAVQAVARCIMLNWTVMNDIGMDKTQQFLSNNNETINYTAIIYKIIPNGTH